MKDNPIDKLFFKYNDALQMLKDKFMKLQQESLSEENPICHIKCRIKSKKSIRNKLLSRNNLAFTEKNIEENLNDIAGIRIICPFLSDIGKIIDYINKDPDITVLSVKNYLESPKENGYSSYHMIVSVPILVNGAIEQVKAEIQIRTMALDAILSLEHKLRYKSNVPFTEEDNQRIATIINFSNAIDKNMDRFIQEKQNQSSQDTPHNKTNSNISKSSLDSFLEKYKIALKKVEEIINSIKNQYLSNEMINPIEHIKGRIKPTASIRTKLEEKEKPLTLENIEEYITDVGAITIVCSFLSDVTELISILKTQTDFIVLEEQDYITNPKECGYSSYHFVVAVPIQTDGKMIFTKIEIQVRTIIMDFWANIEHILCYKKESSPKTKEHLKQLATSLQQIELEMDTLAQSIFKQMTIKRKKDTKRKKKDILPTKPN